MCDQVADPRLARQRQQDRRVARARRRAGVLQAAAGELVAEGAQQEVGVGCGHDGPMAPNLVLLHGFTNTGASWDQVRAALAGTLSVAGARHPRATGRRRPCGRCRWPASWPTSARAATEPFELAGYSMGGRLALHVALALPDRVRRLVLIGASPGIADAGERDERRAADDAAGRRGRGDDDRDVRRALGPDGGARRPAGGRAGRGRTPTGCATLPPAWPRRCEGWARERCRRCGSVCPSSTWRWSWWWASATRSFRRSLAEMAAALADARVHVVAGAGHAVHLEAPGARWPR